MSKKNKLKKSNKAGLAPGTLYFIGEKKVEDISVALINYNLEKTDTHNLKSNYLEQIETLSSNVNWLNIDGLHNLDEIKKICESFNIHNLAMEDIVNTTHRPKIEFFDDYIFIITKMYSYNQKEGVIQSEQVSLILKDNFVLTFQEEHGDVFNPTRERIKSEKSRIRKLGADYLLYSLLDNLVDSYYQLLEDIDNNIDNFEQSIIKDSNSISLTDFFTLKKSLLFLRKSVWPLRDISSQLARGEHDQISNSTLPYMKDLYDHVIQVVDSVEVFRDLTNGITEMYLSITNNKMNEIMKLLTICTSIFIPLTFIVGVYGMNFEYMPELKWKSSYFFLWGLMFFITISLIVFFKKKKWL